jgi:hypothetical protein
VGDGVWSIFADKWAYYATAAEFLKARARYGHKYADKGKTVAVEGK